MLKLRRPKSSIMYADIAKAPVKQGLSGSKTRAA